MQLYDARESLHGGPIRREKMLIQRSAERRTNLEFDIK